MTGNGYNAVGDGERRGLIRHHVNKMTKSNSPSNTDSSLNNGEVFAGYFTDDKGKIQVRKKRLKCFSNYCFRTNKLGFVVWGLFCLQLILLIIEANTLYSRGELTLDYAAFGPAVNQISHLHLNPYVNLPDRGIAPYIQNHFEWITWPIAILFGAVLRIPTWVILLILFQAVPTALVGPLGSYYARRKASALKLSASNTWFVALLPSVLALTNLWLYWDSRFDFHYQAMQSCVVIGIIFAVESDRNVVAVILGITLMATGDTAALMFLPIVMLLLWRRKPKQAAIAVTGALVTLYGSLAFGVATNNATAIAIAFHYLDPSGPAPRSAFSAAELIIAHPGNYLSKLWSNRLDIWSVLAASGFIGLASLVSIVTAVVIGGSSWGSGSTGYSSPLFQTIAVVQLPIFASGVVLVAIIHRQQILGRLVSLAAVVWSVSWLVVLGPALVGQVTSLSNTIVGQSLQHLDNTLPQSNVVLTSNGDLGMFINHRAMVVGCSSNLLLPAGRFNVVIDPWKEIQTCSPFQLLQDLSAYASLPGSSVRGPFSDGMFIVSGNGAFQRHHSIVMSHNAPLLSNFLVAPHANHGVLFNSTQGPYLTNSGRERFVLEGIVAGIPPRVTRQLNLNISVDGSADVQVWNDNSGVEIVQAYLSSHKKEMIRLKFNSGAFVPSKSFTNGFGIFSTKLIPPIPVNAIEFRVWCPSGSTASVYSLQLK